MSSEGVMARLLFGLFVSLALTACSTVIRSTQELDEQPATTAHGYPDRSQAALRSVHGERLAADPLINAVRTVDPGNDALTHRIALSRLAEHSIEMQTYIFKNDLSSMLLLKELMLAADRGVKVRILVDDVGLPPQSSTLMLLGFYPNIEIRIFNPFRFRLSSSALRFSQFVTEFNRLNHRIHNKLFIADDAAMLVGGRNVSKEYFDLGFDFNFLDAEALFIGPMAHAGASSFNEYWDFHMAVPSSFFPEHPDPAELPDFLSEIEQTLAEDEAYVARISREADDLITRYKSSDLADHWVSARFIADPPNKAERQMVGNEILAEVNALLDGAVSSVYISNAYVVPVDFQQKLNDLRDRGVEIHLSTNSLSSNDVWLVYSGWINYRTDLIERGVHVHEFRHDADFAQSPQGARSGLHSKIIVVDGRYSVFGSLNLDPRSVWLNTETIVIIDSQEFAQAVIETLQAEMSHEKSWQVRRIDGRTVWETRRNGEQVIVRHSPDVFILKRVLARLVSFIVPEWLL
jgi:phosphatidylserine/phosphatidylglycerophosphate/cardiolipin synthase-like enzyme